MVKIFADINCPFCFAQHERLAEFDLLKDVEWCYVEHAPELDSAANSPEQLALLNEEYQLLCMRSKNLNTQKPDFCVNSRLAILSLISVQKNVPDKVPAYRRAIYTAYWREGRDISDPNVLQDIQLKLGMICVDNLEESEQIQASYQKQWEYGGLDGRIPAMKDEQGRILLGLQHVGNIRAFMHGLENLDLSTLVCSVHEKPVIGFYDVPELKRFFKQEEHRYRFIDYGENVSSLAYGPDIILMKSDEEELSATFNNLRLKNLVSSYTPIILFCDEVTDGIEIKGFNNGAVDVLPLTDHSLTRSLFSRIDSHIKKYHALLNLKEHASIDPLTGLLNKRMLDRQFNEEWRSACRNRDTLSLIVLDIDHFKKYNDQYGHSQGDECLAKVARALQNSVARPKDLVARFGGEEFVVLLPDTDLNGANSVAKKISNIITGLNIPHLDNNSIGRVSVSMGVASTEPHADRTPNDLFEFCDSLLYLAKSQGRNRYIGERMHAPDYQVGAL